MFDRIAGRYDFLNRFLSLGRDLAWRRKAARHFIRNRDRMDIASGGARNPRPRILDLCGGTGDFFRILHRDWALSPAGKRGGPGEDPFGIIADFSWPMLRRARHKRLHLGPGARNQTARECRCDALRLPFRAQTFEAVLCGFGIRNLDSMAEGLDEVGRVLRPGGLFITLEFFRPANALTRLFYHGIAPKLLPRLADLFLDSRGAYRYLVESVRAFSSPAEYGALLLSKGFEGLTIESCDGGLSHIVTVRKKKTKGPGRGEGHG